MKTIFFYKIHERAFANIEILILKILTISVLLGRAWQHLFWDVPFRALMWDESLMTPVVKMFGMSWQDYIMNLEIAYQQEFVMQVIGVFYLILIVFIFFVNAARKWIKPFLWLSSFFLFALSLLYWKENFYRIGQLIEYTIQWTIPIFLIFAIYKTQNTTQFRFWLKIAIALTFIGHGLYAFGYYPVPGKFVQMILDMLALNDGQATMLLKVMGVLDFVVAIGLFLPFFWKISIWYCVLWGFATAFARIVTNFDAMMPMESASMAL
ncbi:MAG: hypothetical protein HC803_09635 [Saprospiraceae bacterium]|nr:hypothetical protein [Saprospiraceae bacterium]